MKPSSLPALTASTMKPGHLDLRVGAPSSIVCPDCGTWRHLKRRMIWPHRLDRTTSGGPTLRCPGSARLVDLDLTVEQWQAKRAKAKSRLADVDVDAGSRNGTRVKRQRTEVAPAVMHLVPGPISAESVRRTYADHREACAACLGRTGCRDGERLATTYAALLRQEPRRRQAQARLDQSQRDVDRRRALQQPAKRAAEWAAVRPSVTRADEQRTVTGPALSDYRGPDLPLKPLRITA